MGFFGIGYQGCFFGQFESTVACEDLFGQFLDPDGIFQGVREEHPVIGVPDQVVPGVSLLSHVAEGIPFLRIVGLFGMVFPLRGNVLVEVM